METDSDRLAMINSLGGQSCVTDRGDFKAIFDSAYQSALADPPMEGTAPALMCRSSDLERLKLRKGEPVTVDGTVYRVNRFEPDGTGMTNVVLKT